MPKYAAYLSILLSSPQIMLPSPALTLPSPALTLPSISLVLPSIALALPSIPLALPSTSPHREEGVSKNVQNRQMKAVFIFLIVF